MKRRIEPFHIPVKRPMRFRLMVLSHGWYDLSPFAWDERRCALETTFLHGGKAITLRVTSENDRSERQRLRVEQRGGERLTVSGRKEAAARLAWIFRLEEDFSPFHVLCRRHGALPWVADEGLGAFLRNPSLFEEFTKILLTTNVSWAGTKSMVRALLDAYGTPTRGYAGRGEPLRAFPAAETLAGATERELRENIHAGYRAPYLLAFAEEVASGRLDLDRFGDGERPTEELAREIGAIRGFGPYAVSALLMSLGRYDRLILDSWTRKTVAAVHFRSPRVTDRSIERHYARWNEWKVLACWFDCAWKAWMRQAAAREAGPPSGGGER